MTDIDWYLYEGEKNLSAADLMIEVLVRLNTTVFDNLVNLSGIANALAAVKPYRRKAAPYFAEMARKIINVQGNGPDALLLTYAFLSTPFAPPHLVSGEIRERGAVGTTRECVFKNASPELCMSISHFNSEALTDYMNPEYECVWTHHQSNGDEYCRYVFKKKSDPFSILDDLGKTLVVLPKFEVPKEQNQAASLWAFSATIYATTRGFVDLHGSEKTIEILGPNAEMIGKEIGTWLTEHSPELVDDPASLVKLIRGMYNALGQKDRFSIRSNELFTNEITDCSQQQWGCELCIQYESLFNGMVGAINPSYEFFYDRMIPQGDKTCHWTIRKKGEESTKVEPVASENKMEERVTEDPIRLLALNLAKGEITEEEFERKMELLKKHKAGS